MKKMGLDKYSIGILSECDHDVYKTYIDDNNNCLNIYYVKMNDILNNVFLKEVEYESNGNLYLKLEIVE